MVKRYRRRRLRRKTIPKRPRKRRKVKKTFNLLFAIIVILATYWVASCQKELKKPPKPQKIKKTLEIKKIKEIAKPKEVPKPKEVRKPLRPKKIKKPLKPKKVKKPQKVKKIEVIKPKKIQGKIAIVLDDWGYNLENFKMLQEIEEPLTLAILPNLNYSREIAQKAQRFKKEVILHLPLEPYNKEDNSLEQNTIFVDMPEEEILKILEGDIKSIPGLKGINNHMGSKATENEHLMRIIFMELKKRDLFFLDSFTSKSICKDLARSIGLPYARRDIFLDNDNDYNSIRTQFEILALAAKEKGFAIGIGHDRTKTLEVLSKVIPDFKKRGFKFVYVSELIR